MKSFFLSIKNSIYNPAFYQEVVLQKPVKNAIKYYLRLALLLGIIAAVAFSLLVIPKLQKVINAIGVKIVQFYPDELVLTAQKGKISANVSQPYFIPMPPEMADEEILGHMSLNNLVVIDTLNEFSFERFANYHTVVWITQDGFAVIDENTGVRYQPLSESISGTLDKALVRKLEREAVPIINLVLQFLSVVVFVLILLWFLVIMAYLLFVALIVRFIAKKRGLDLTFSQAYAASLYLATFGLIWALIDAFIMSFEISFGFTVIVLVLAYLNLRPIQVGTPSQSLSEETSLDSQVLSSGESGE